MSARPPAPSYRQSSGSVADNSRLPAFQQHGLPVNSHVGLKRVAEGLLLDHDMFCRRLPPPYGCLFPFPLSQRRAIETNVKTGIRLNLR